MSTYDFSQLVKHWGMESITSEQAIGQILLHLQSLRERVVVLERLAPNPKHEEESNDEVSNEKVSNNVRSEEPTEEVSNDLGNESPIEDD